MRIIDAHAHLGQDCVFDELFTDGALLDKHRRCGIAASIVQPATCHDLASVVRQHNAIAALAALNPGMFYGMANPNPHLDEDSYRHEVERCMSELHFVGIKLHPAAHAAPPGGRDSRKVFEMARKLKVPVMVHTGNGIPFANPANLIPLAELYPDVPIIMAHSGMMISTGEIGVVMSHCPNTYADVSWVGGFIVERLTKEFGAHRFMFGSDHAENASTEIEKIRGSRMTEEDKEWVLGKTAARLFGIPQEET